MTAMVLGLLLLLALLLLPWGPPASPPATRIKIQKAKSGLKTR